MSAAPSVAPRARPSGRGGRTSGPWLRRRADLRRRRAWQRATNWALGALVVLSVVLGTVLWSGALWRNRLPPVGAPYQAPNTVQRAGPASVLLPDRLIVLYPGAASVQVAEGTNFAVIWSAAKRILTHLRPAQFAVGSNVGYKAVARRSLSLQGSGAGLEIDFGSVFPWSTLDAALGGPAAWRSRPNPLLDTIILLPGASPPRCPLVASSGGSAAVDFFLGSDPGLQVPLDPRAYCALAAVLGNGQGRVAGYPVAPIVVDSPAAALPVAPGVLAPTVFPWRPVRLLNEPLNADRLALSIFEDAGAVVIGHAGGGLTVFRDPQDRTLSVGAGRAVLVVPAPPAAASSAPDWVVGLREAIGYVNTRGGWPRSTWLAWSRAECTLVKCDPGAYQYGFATSFESLPVLSPTGTPPALSVQIMGGSGQPTLYTRAVPVPGPLVTAGGQGPGAISAEQAVLALAATPPASLLGASPEVVGVLPAWAPIPTAHVLEPVWALQVHEGTTGGLQTVLVDAYRRTVLGLWPPQ